MSSHTVFRINPKEGFESLHASQEPIPTIDKNEVLIKARSVALNFRDVAIATGRYPLAVKENNLVPCSDLAGEIIRVGDAVTGFTIGDKVILPVNLLFLYGNVVDVDDTFGGVKDGVLRQYIAVPGHAVIKLPDSTQSFAEWAAIVCTASTVWNAFYGNNPLKPGDTVLILGTGGIALTALVFAKAAGATTIITSSSDEKLEYVKSQFGADHTINYKARPEWSVEVNNITSGRGVDHIIEIGGSGTIEQSIASVAQGGIITMIGFLKTTEKHPDVSLLLLQKNAILRGILSGSKQQLEEAVRFMGTHNLVVPVDKTFGFDREEIISALNYVASGAHSGKICINLD